MLEGLLSGRWLSEARGMALVMTMMALLALLALTGALVPLASIDRNVGRRQSPTGDASVLCGRGGTRMGRARASRCSGLAWAVSRDRAIAHRRRHARPVGRWLRPGFFKMRPTNWSRPEPAPPQRVVGSDGSSMRMDRWGRSCRSIPRTGCCSSPYGWLMIRVAPRRTHWSCMRRCVVPH